MQTLLLVGVGLMGRPYVAAARRLGVRVHAVETPQRVTAIADQVDGTTVCRGDADELWAEAAVAAAHRVRPDAVVAFSEPQVLAAALVADEFGLPGPSLRAATLSRNKALQRGRFAAAGIGQPDYLVTDRLGAERAWVADRLPVVVKPLSSAGSAGVEHVADLAAYSNVAARRDGEGRLLVEQAVPGPEFSWEALVVDGQVWFANLTAKETTGPPHFVETAHWAAAEVDPPTASRIAGFGAQVLAAVGMRTGLVHLEFRMGPAGPAVMEIAVRTPGDYLMDLLNLTYGMDWFELVVLAALGRPLPQPPPVPVRYAASYLPLAPTAGRVSAVRGLESVRAHPHVVRAGVSVAPGDRVWVAENSNQRVGHVLLAAPDRKEVTAALDEIRRTLTVFVEPTS